MKHQAAPARGVAEQLRSDPLLRWAHKRAVFSSAMAALSVLCIFAALASSLMQPLQPVYWTITLLSNAAASVVFSVPLFYLARALFVLFVRRPPMVGVRASRHVRKQRATQSSRSTACP